MMDTISTKQGIRILRLVGYGLFILVLFDFADIWIPAQFMNPTWELQAIGSMVEKVPLLWLSLALIFFAEYYGYGNRERLVLKALSWFALLAGVLYFLLIPISAFNLVRADRQNSQRVTTEIAQRMPVIQQIKTEAKQVETAADLTKVLEYLDKAGVRPNIENGQKIQDVKAQIVSTIAQGESDLKVQAQATIDSQRLSLIKKSLKWTLGSLISGVLLIGIWRATRWVRQMPLEGKSHGVQTH